MFKIIKARNDYYKCLRVLGSCYNFGHLTSASNMIHNYGKMYGYNKRWSVLDKKAYSMWKEIIDRLDYEERLKEINE